MNCNLCTLQDPEQKSFLISKIFISVEVTSFREFRFERRQKARQLLQLTPP